MGIKYIEGDIFDQKVTAIVNTVNCVGVMGKGLALQFKKKYPENFSFYKSACDDNRVRPGKMLIFDRGGNKSPRFLINFPTKDDWRNPSKLEYVETGLIDLIKRIQELNIKSIAVPALGCDLGKLDWNIVKDVMNKHFQLLTKTEVTILLPR